MAIEIQVNGFFEMTIFRAHTNKEVSKQEEKIVLENLQNGEYLFGVNSKTIVSLDNLERPLYRVELDATTALEYEFNEL